MDHNNSVIKRLWCSMSMLRVLIRGCGAANEYYNMFFLAKLALFAQLLLSGAMDIHIK